jgi:cysteinyl-tRNA synthetase
VACKRKKRPSRWAIFFTIREVLEKYDAEMVRFSFFARTTALNYSDAHPGDARNSLKRLYTALAHHPADGDHN